MLEILWFSLIGAALVLDTSLVFQSLISQPLIACTLLGWYMGDVEAGLHFGFLMQMVWLGNMPVGGSALPAGNLASITGLAVYVGIHNIFPEQPYTVLLISIFYVILLSAIGSRITIWTRMQSVALLDRAVASAKKGLPGGISKVNLFSVLLNYVIYVVFIITGIIAGHYALKRFVGILPHSWDVAARYTEMAIIGVGIGTVLPLYKNKKVRYIVLAGISIGIIIYFIF